MKKIIKNPIFTFILGAILFGGTTGVLAATLLASNIEYTPKDKTWKVNNVKDAIDDLYQNNTIGKEEIILTNTTSYQLPTFETYSWASEDSAVTISSSNVVTVTSNGKHDVYLEKNGKKYFKYVFDYQGPVLIFVDGSRFSSVSVNSGNNGTLSQVSEVLFDGIKTHQGQYGALLMSTASNLKFTVTKNVDITFTSGSGYGDSGGSDGSQYAQFYKVNSDNSETLYTRFVQKRNGSVTQSFEPGTYMLRAAYNYVCFDEWEVTVKN